MLALSQTSMYSGLYPDIRLSLGRIAWPARRRVAGLDPVPGVQDVGTVVVARLGLDEHRAAEDLGLELLPLARADHGDALDVLGVLREELDLLPARGPVRAGHVGEVGEDPDRALAAFSDRALDLREKCLRLPRP